jgi:adenylate cyclase, class 2
MPKFRSRPTEAQLGTETEVKITIDDPEDFCRRLNPLEPRILSARHFEDNHLLDFPGGLLKSGQRLVRIRQAAGLSFLTFKGPPRAEGIFKTREELETRLEDGAVTLRIFEQLGMSVWFRYQKYRRELAVGSIHVAVDETPVGNFVEFEGSEAGILELARRLNIAESRFLRLSYYALYLEHCRARDIAPGHMVF